MGLKFLSYKIPFSRPFSTVRKKFTFREGIILTLNKNRITALGEAAPLPGFSRDTLDEVKTQIQDLKPAFGEFFRNDFSLQGLKKFNDEYAVKTSLRFGLFTLTAMYLAQQKQKNLHQSLFGDVSDEVSINAVVDLNTRDISSQIKNYVQSGFNTVKIKTGTNWQRDIPHIKKLLGEFSSLQIRVDVNQSLTLDEAKQFLKQLEPLQIEYCEEPLQRPSPESLKMLTQYTSTPVSLDETMAFWPKTEQHAFYASALIIKPMVIGGHENINAVCNFAVKQNKKLVFTTSLGTGVERLMTATLAAGLGSKNMAHGLDTANLLAADVWNDENFVQNGIYTLPDFKQLNQLMQSDLRPLSPEIL